METIPEIDDKQELSGDQVGGDKISSGNVAGSVAAIGAGANVIYNKVERALTQIEFLQQAEEFENKRLAQALTAYVHRLEERAGRAREHPFQENPYKALLEFDIQDTALFYGRSTAILKLLAHIKRDQLTVLHAGSGVGKTSLLKAGIMPRLLADGHVPLYVRPYQTPVHLAIKQALPINLEDSTHLANISLYDFLRRATSLISGRELIVILDQFEELFTVQNEQARKEFVDQLSTCLDDDLLPVRWIIALRDEWFGQLGTFRPHIRNPYANEFLLRPLSRSEAKEVIIRPAERCQIDYEPALVERLLDDLGKNEIAPPHLQLVCSVLFDSLRGHSEITQAMYDEAGEAKEILRQYLYRVLSRDMPQEMRAPARRLLEALVTLEKRRTLRTRADLQAELSTWGYSPSLVDEVLNQLTDSRLLRVEEFALDRAHSVVAYELAHDYLLEEIELDPEVQARKAAQELLAQKLPYYKREKLLLSSHELSIIWPQREWLTLSEETSALLRESEAVVTRERRMRRVRTIAAVLLVVTALATIAFQQRNIASREKIAADRNARMANTAIAAEGLAQEQANAASAAQERAEGAAIISLSHKLVAEAELAKNLGQVLPAHRLAVKSYETADTFESRSALYTALSLPLPERIFKVPGGAVDVVFTANFSPQNDRMVTANSDSTARIWDVESGKQLHILKGHTDQVLFAEFSPDGTRVATSSEDATVRVWDARDGSSIQTILAHQKEIHSVSFHPDGNRVVTASRDNTAVVWELSTGKKVFTLSGHKEPVLFADFSPSGMRLITGSEDDTARVWDAFTGRLILVLEGHKGNVNHVTFNPDSTLIATASSDRTAQVWDAKTGKLKLFLVPHNGDVTSVNFSPDGRFILTTSADHLARIWNATDGTLITELPGHIDQVKWASFSSDARWIATASSDAEVWLRKASGISGALAFMGHTHSINSVNFNRDGTQIVTASRDRTAAVWDVRSGMPLLVLKGHQRGLTYAAFSPDGTQIATVSGDETVRVWDAVTGAELYAISENALTLSFTPDGRQLITTGKDGIARLWSLKTGEKLYPTLEGHLDEINTVSFSPDGRRIVTAGGTRDGTVKVWDAKTYRLLATFTILANNEVNSAFFSPDGTRLVVAADEGIVQVWDVERAVRVFELEGHLSDVGSAVYSPDGRLIVTASDDHTIRLWDAMDGQELAVLKDHSDEVSWAIFSPDGKWIFSSSNDRTVRTWLADIDELYKFIRGELLSLNIE